MEDLDNPGSDLSNSMPDVGNFFRMGGNQSIVKTIENDKVIMKIHEHINLIECTVKEDVTIDVKDVWQNKKLMEGAFPGKKFYVLAMGVDFFTVTKEARKATATAQYSENIKAIAFYASNPSIFLLGKMHIKIVKPVIPTNIFYNLEEAREWLFEQMKT